MTGNTNGEVAVLSPFIRNLLNDDASFNKRYLLQHKTTLLLLQLFLLTILLLFFFNFLLN